MFYESIGIPIDRAGSLIFASGIWDLINDPIIATIIDKGKTGPGQKGKFTRWLAPIVPFFAMSSVLLFINPPLNSINAKIAVCFLAYFIYETFATFTGIAWQTMPLIMSPLQDERSNYLTFGNLFGQLTGALPGLIPVAYSLLAESGEARPALLRASTFFTVTAIFFAVMGCTTALFSKNLKERVFAPKQGDRFFENLRTFLEQQVLPATLDGEHPEYFCPCRLDCRALLLSRQRGKLRRTNLDMDHHRRSDGFGHPAGAHAHQAVQAKQCGDFQRIAQRLLHAYDIFCHRRDGLYNVP